jgi:hypothetical protein
MRPFAQKQNRPTRMRTSKKPISRYFEWAQPHRPTQRATLSLILKTAVESDRLAEPAAASALNAFVRRTNRFAFTNPLNASTTTSFRNTSPPTAVFRIIRALCACAALVCCLCTTGCFTLMTQTAYSHTTEVVLHSGDFQVKEIFADSDIPFEELTDPAMKKPLTSIVLEGEWVLDDDEHRMIKYGYIYISAANWKKYVSHSKKNNLDLSPVGALEFDFAQRNFFSVRSSYQIKEGKFESELKHNITSKFPPNPKPRPIKIPLTEEAKKTYNPKSLLLLLVSVPVDIITSPIQLAFLQFVLEAMDKEDS